MNMRGTIKYLPLILLLNAPRPLSAQFQDVVRMVIEKAGQNTPAPAPTRAASVRQASTPAKRSAKTQTEKPKPKPTPAVSDSNTTRRFDGTWLATRSKSNADGDQINQIFTLVIKDGKAVKTLDTTNISGADRPFYESARELHRKWTYNSNDCTATGSALTIQWPAGQLADWSPKAIPSDVIQSYGNPNAETSLYTLKGDELTRVNDPSGVTYHRAR